MIELKQNKIWTDSLSSALGLVNPWDELEKPLRKFICFAGGGGGPGDGDGDGYGLSDIDLDAMITYAPAESYSTNSPDFGGEFSGFDDYGVMDGFASVSPFGSNSPYTGEDQGAAYRNTSLPPEVLYAIQQDNLKPNQYGVPNAEWMGLTYNSNIAVPVEPGMPPPTDPYFSFSFPEFVMDLAEMALPFLSGLPIGSAIRSGLSSIDPSNTLGMNTMSLAEEIGSTLGLVSSDIGSTFLGSPAARGIDAVAAAVNPFSSSSITANVPGEVTTPSTVFSSVISGNNPFSFSNSPNTTTAFSNNPTFNNETNSILEPRPLNGLASLSETDILPNIGSTSVSSAVINQPTSSISQSIRPPNRPLTVEEALRIARQGGGFNTRQGGGLISLEAGGQPAKGTPPEGYRFNEEDYRNQFTAYQEWLAQHGGGEGLDKDAIKGGRIDTVYLPGAGEYEYFSFGGNNRAGAGIYDEVDDLFTIPWAYPESPDFNKAWNAGNQGRNIFNNPYRRPSRSQTTEQFLATRLPVQAVRDQREVNDTSQTFTGLNSLATQGGLSNLFRPTDETIEEEDLTIDTSFAQSGGNIGGLVSLQEGGQPNPTYQAYQKWLAGIGGFKNLDKAGLAQGRIDMAYDEEGPIHFANPYPEGDSPAGLYTGDNYNANSWAFPEHPDFRNTFNRVKSGSNIMFDTNTGRALPQQQQVILSSTDQFLKDRDTINSVRDQRELTNRPLQSVSLSSLATRGGPSNFFRPTDETIEEEDLTIDTSFAQSGGNIGGLMNTGPNVIDVINKGMAMPENIGAVQMQEKIDINQSTPYTGR